MGEVGGGIVVVVVVAVVAVSGEHIGVDIVVVGEIEIWYCILKAVVALGVVVVVATAAAVLVDGSSGHAVVAALALRVRWDRLASSGCDDAVLCAYLSTRGGWG